MAVNLALAVFAAVTLAGLVAWLYRRGVIGARYRTARQELRQIGQIQREGKQIDEATDAEVDRLVHDHDDGLRRFWLRDD